MRDSLGQLIEIVRKMNGNRVLGGLSVLPTQRGDNPLVLRVDPLSSPAPLPTHHTAADGLKSASVE